MKYSIYDAKAHLSQIIRQVKANRPVTITERGVPVAEVVPYRLRARRPLAARLSALEEAGRISGATKGSRSIDRLADRPGALDRFLAGRE